MGPYLRWDSWKVTKVEAFTPFFSPDLCIVFFFFFLEVS